MHLPFFFFLTLMEQFNVISEGSRAAGKARVMREGYPVPLSGTACGSRDILRRLWGREVGETALAGPSGLWGA